MSRARRLSALLLCLRREFKDRWQRRLLGFKLWLHCNVSVPLAPLRDAVVDAARFTRTETAPAATRPPAAGQAAEEAARPRRAAAEQTGVPKRRRSKSSTPPKRRDPNSHGFWNYQLNRKARLRPGEVPHLEYY